MKRNEYDVAVIGAGAAGLAAAAVSAKAGASTIVIDRDVRPGGVLNQCIHNGFGLHYFKEELTGPEYAARMIVKAKEAGAIFRIGASVMEISPAQADGRRALTLYSKDGGVEMILAKAVILAMGCRERTRGNLATPGSRCAGIYTAGLAQRMLNVEGKLPGTSAVIVGSGDIGLIMARRLTWSGIPVKAAVEIQPKPAGLARNIAQCLEDFGIPLYLSTAVTKITGKDRVESVTIAPLDNPADECVIECDTILYSVGLIPENELSRKAGVVLDPKTNGPVVEEGVYETTEKGIFACGNVLHVHGLADHASEEAERCAESALRSIGMR